MNRMKESFEWDAEKFLNAVLTRDNDAIVDAAMGWYRANKDDDTLAYSADALRASVEDNDAEGIYENMDDLIGRAMMSLMPNGYKKYVKSGLPKDPVPVVERFLRDNHKQHSMRVDRFESKENNMSKIDEAVSMLLGEKMETYDFDKSDEQKAVKAMRAEVKAKKNLKVSSYTKTEGGSNKFYTVGMFRSPSKDGTQYSVASAYGRIGYEPKVTFSGTYYDTKSDAEEAFDKLVAKKTKKGYKEAK